MTKFDAYAEKVHALREKRRNEEINLQLNMKEASKVNKLQVCEIDIVNNYKTEKNYTNLLISLVLTVVIVIGVVIYTIIKKRKNKQYN